MRRRKSLSTGGTARAARSPTRRSRPGSSARSSGRPTPSPSSSRAGSSRTRSSTGARTGSRTRSATSAPSPAASSRSACRERRTSSSPSSASSSLAPRTCRSTPRTRRPGWPGSSRTPSRLRSSRTPSWRGVCLRMRSSCLSTATSSRAARTRARRPPRPPRISPTSEDRVLGFASITFDVSVFEIFSALLTGARLYLAPDEERLEIDRLQELMERAGITVIDLPPTVMALLEPERFEALRIVFVGGEAFPGELVNRWRPDRRFFNGYGPTECTVTMTVEECSGDCDGSLPTGLPMANHVAHVLARNLEPVPPGVLGELVIGGAGLARGYLNRPELTEEKFVPDPFETSYDRRLYRTGDLVKRLHDGRLVFVGRIDRQVKIRGQRIELGEIESTVATHPKVGQTVVEAWTDERGEKHLVSYVAPTPGADLDLGGLRSFLAGRLPTSMVPAFFVALDELPLNASGKVDRAALPPPETSRPVGEETPPRNETERALVEEIVVPILGVERVGIHDNFFELGGNSLQAAQLISKIRRRFDTDVSPADFFPSPPLANLASLVDRQR